jgi:hypothetical protein
MSHMFRVDFICNHANGMVESGRSIVVAESHEQVIDIICTLQNLPPSRTRIIDSVKIKPPCYSVETRQSHPNAKPAMRNQRDGLEPQQRYQLFVQVSNVYAHGENQALRKAGEELIARGMQTRLRHNLEMMIDCSEGSSTSPRKTSPLERIEMLGARANKRGLQGGRVK